MIITLQLEMDPYELATWFRAHGVEGLAARLAADALDALLAAPEPWQILAQFAPGEGSDNIYINIDSRADRIKDDLPDCMLHGNAQDCAAGNHDFVEGPDDYETPLDLARPEHGRNLVLLPQAAFPGEIATTALVDERVMLDGLDPTAPRALATPPAANPLVVVGPVVRSGDRYGDIEIGEIRYKSDGRAHMHDGAAASREARQQVVVIPPCFNCGSAQCVVPNVRGCDEDYAWRCLQCLAVFNKDEAGNEC